MTLEEELAAFKTSGGQRLNEPYTNTPNTQERYLTEDEYLRFTGKQQQQSKYNADNEMESLKKELTEEQIRSSKLPRAILESIADNPLDIPISDPRMDAFAAKIAAKAGKDPSSYGLSRSAEIIAKVEGRKVPVVNESLSTTNNISTQPSGVNYELIQAIVEKAVEKKISEMGAQLLNESRSSQNGSPIKVMQIHENGKFLFLDSDDNIYECTMVFKRKNKKRQ